MSAPFLYLSHPGVCRPHGQQEKQQRQQQGRNHGAPAESSSTARQPPPAEEAGTPAAPAPRRPPSSRPTGWTGTARCWPERPCSAGRRTLHRQKSRQPQDEGQQQDIAPCDGAFPPHHALSSGAGRQQGVHAALSLPGEAARTAAGSWPKTRRPAPKHPDAGHPHPTAADSRSDTGTPAPAAGRGTGSAPCGRRPPRGADSVWLRLPVKGHRVGIPPPQLHKLLVQLVKPCLLRRQVGVLFLAGRA